MRILWLLLSGLAGGLVAGMGMGGGTLTMPLMVLLVGVEQLTAQYCNLLSFLPTGAAASLIHQKNGYIDAAPLKFMLLPALIAATASSLFASSLPGALLKRLFGGFLIAVAAFSFVITLLKKLTNK